MTLQARIAIVPSRRLALLAGFVPAGGIVVAAATLAARWPDAAAPLASLAIVAIGVLLWVALVRHGRAVPFVLSVSDRADFDIAPSPRASGGTWRLAGSTVVWPGFAMLAVRVSDAAAPGGVAHFAVLDAELAPRDRRSLGRFLLWSLRGGDGAAAARDGASGRA